MNPPVPLDAVDRDLLQTLQDGFPLEIRPWQAVAEKVHCTEAAALARARRLSAEGVIRSLHAFVSVQGPHRSTLVALRVAEPDLARAAAVINTCPAVTHNYRRDHMYNLWFTLSAPDACSLGESLEGIRRMLGVEESALLDLRSLRVFKVDVRFPLTSGDLSLPLPSPAPLPALPADPADRMLLDLAQEDLPLVREPFRAIAANLGIGTAQVIARLRTLHEAGSIRRVGISINQRKLGIVANALVAWNVPEERTGITGRMLAGYPEITHCYERTRIPQRWEYSLYTVHHGYDRHTVSARVHRIAEDIGVQDPVILFSTDQYKRSRMIHRCAPPSPCCPEGITP